MYGAKLSQIKDYRAAFCLRTREGCFCIDIAVKPLPCFSQCFCIFAAILYSETAGAEKMNILYFLDGERQLTKGKGNGVFAFIDQIDVPSIHTAFGVGIHLLKIGAGL